MKGSLATLLIGLIRRDFDREDFADTDLSFWSRDKPLFTTLTGTLIPADSNSPTAELKVFTWEGGIAYDFRAFPSAEASGLFDHGSLDNNIAAAATGMRQLLLNHVTADEAVAGDLIAWSLTRGDLRDVATKRTWQIEYSLSDAWDIPEIADHIGGGVFVEVRRAAEITCDLSKDLLTDEMEWEHAVSSHILTALLPRPGMS